MSARGVTVGGWLTATLFAAIVLVPLTAAWTQAADLGHGWAVPLLIAYLWWERWDERPTLVRNRGGSAGWWLIAALLVGCALPLRLLLTPFPLWPAALAAYLVVLVGLAQLAAWLAAGRAGLRWVGGPLIILLGALPWPSIVDAKFVGPMRESLAALAAEICYLSGVPALAAGTTVRLAQSWVGVDETCGGMRSLQASVMAALFLGEWLRLRWSRRVGLVAVGIAAAVLGNFLRILLLVWRASVGGEDALNAAHDLAGWLALATSLGLTGLVARWMQSTPRPMPAVAATPRPEIPRATLGYIASLVFLLGAFELGTRWWYHRGETQIIARESQWQVRFPGGEAGFRAVPLADAAREMLRPDLYAAGEWRNESQRTIGAYYVEWNRGSAARSIPFAHNPTVCLPISGCELVRDLGEIMVPWAGGEIPFNAYIFRRAGEEFAVAFTIWDPSRGRRLENEGAGWNAWMTRQFLEVREARAHQPGQLLSVLVGGDKADDHLLATITPLIGRRSPGVRGDRTTPR